MPYPLQTSRYERLFRKLLEMQGPVPLELIEQVMGIWALEVDRPEWFYLRGEILASANASVTSAAGTVAEFGIFNPAASGKLAVVNAVQTGSTLGEFLGRHFITALPAGTTPMNASVRDTRLRPGGPFVSTTVSAMQPFTATPAVADGGFIDSDYLVVASDEFIELISSPLQAIVLGPGTGVLWAGETVGVSTVHANMHWYEKLVGAET